MTLRVWWDEPADGPCNMAADELLAAEASDRGEICMRIYGWQPATVSLGGFQRGVDARAERSIAGVPIVRRPSGGGAIVHGSDLTYAAAVPRSHGWARSPEVFYDSVHRALVAALADAGVSATLHVAAADDPPPTTKPGGRRGSVPTSGTKPAGGFDPQPQPGA
jgi:lipoate-protein ligase A